MKPLPKIFVLFLCVSTFTWVCAFAQTDPMQVTEQTLRLSGHAKPLNIAFKEGQEVLVVKMLSVGRSSLASSGVMRYLDAEAKVTKALKGNLGGILHINYTIKTSGNDYESCPTLGVEYIIFIQKIEPDEYRVHKIVLSDNTAIDEVKALIGRKE